MFYNLRLIVLQIILKIKWKKYYIFSYNIYEIFQIYFKLKLYRLKNPVFPLTCLPKDS